jgi:hypothetical protein
MPMLIFSLLSWWYGQGWVWIAKRSIGRIENALESFSVGILIRTMFAPWKQIVSQTGAQSAIGIKFRALIDNLVSRFVGFMVRLMVLFAALITVVALGLLGILIVLSWPMVPFSILVLLFAGVGIIKP